MMKMITGRVSRTGRLICCALLLSLCSSFLLSTPTSAASVFNYDRWYSISNTNFSSGTLSFPQNTITGTGAVTIPANASLGGSNWKKTNITFVAPNTPPSTEFKNGNSFTTTFSLVTNNPYLGQAGTSRAVGITCPILDTRFNTTDCQIDSIETSFDERHYIVWNFVITGSISTTTDADRIVAQLDIVNYSDSPVTLWVLPARSAYGEGSFTVIRNILGNVQQMNSYLGGISTALTNSNNYLSTIQSLVNQILAKMDASSVAGVVSELQEMNDRDEQDRDDAQQVVDDSQTSAESASEQVGTATASLTQTIGAFAATFSTPASNCQIPVNNIGPDGVLDLGNIDLCHIPDDMHSLISTILNLIAVAISIALAVNTFRMITEIIGMFAGVGFGYERHYQSSDSWTTAGLINQWSSGHDFEA